MKGIYGDYMYKNYIFDLYGTLVDIKTDENKEELWDKMAIFYGFFGAYYDGEEFRKKFFKYIEKMEDVAGEDKDVEINLEDVFFQLFKKKKVRPKTKVVRESARMFRMLSLEYIKLYPNVLNVLDELKKNGKKLYILSNAQECFTKYELKSVGLDKYFDAVYISSEYGKKKPSKDYYNHIIEDNKLNVKKTVMIGNDYSTDIEGAKRVGLDSVYIRTNLENKEAEYVKPTFDIEDGDITKLIKLTVKGAK